MLASSVPVLWAAPFALLLLSIAVLPLMAAHWWERNRNKAIVAAAAALPVVAWALTNRPAALGHAAHEYVAFVLLLGSLYVVSGGLFLGGDLRATPRTNTAFLATGALLANLVGTTGAAMLLIRPLLATNAERTRVAHTVVFFIFVVCNIGGCLTPLADPPLFLGYLAGVPFAWTLRLLPWWTLANGLLLVTYFLVDTWHVRREPPVAVASDRTHVRPLRLEGGRNLAFLAAIVAVVGFQTPSPWMEFAFASIAVASWFSTPKGLHARNAFTWHPIVEVAVLFAGIFAAMVPAVEMLRADGASLGVTTPRAFFWSTGALSGVLDNAPTYLTFLSIAQSLGLPDEVVGVPHRVLVGISLGAVFMGANTYIGNGPNFMVKAVAEARGVRMPSFFGYLRYSLVVLVPLYLLISWLAF
jgi:Na+/H+ antiporter NhaD/arsenite permease-like protein